MAVLKLPLAAAAAYLRLSILATSLAVAAGLSAALLVIAEAGPGMRAGAPSRVSAPAVDRQWTSAVTLRNAAAFRHETLAAEKPIFLFANRESGKLLEAVVSANARTVEVTAAPAGGALEAAAEPVEAESPAVPTAPAPAAPKKEAEPEPRPAAPPAAPVLATREGLQIDHFLTNVNITFYDCLSQGFCGHMYGGRIVYEGAAACSWDLPLGTMFTIVGDPTKRVYKCEDRGLLANTWVDIFWHDPADGWAWQASVGRYGTIEILSRP